MTSTARREHIRFPSLHLLATVLQVMVNVRAARRYGIYPRSFSIPDEGGGARVFYVKTTEGISCVYAPRPEEVRQHHVRLWFLRTNPVDNVWQSTA